MLTVSKAGRGSSNPPERAPPLFLAPRGGRRPAELHRPPGDHRERRPPPYVTADGRSAGSAPRGSRRPLRTGRTTRRPDARRTTRARWAVLNREPGQPDPVGRGPGARRL